MSFLTRPWGGKEISVYNSLTKLSEYIVVISGGGGVCAVYAWVGVYIYTNV